MISIIPIITSGFLTPGQLLSCPVCGVNAVVTREGIEVDDLAFTDPTVAMAHVTRLVPPEDAGWKFWKVPNSSRGFPQPLEHVRAAFLKRTDDQSVRTSDTHPLRINQLPVPNLPGMIGLTFCPGKCGEAIYGGRWERDLTKDLAVVRVWGPTVVVTLLEEHEFTELGIPQFPEVMREQQFEWLLLRIRDSDIPGQDFEEAWSEVGTCLLDVLSRGGSVLIHCRGGLGRTGVVAARLLIEAGTDPDLAARLVREARPGAIETWEQYQYVLSLTAKRS